MTRLIALACAIAALAVGGFLFLGRSGPGDSAALIGPANAQEAADIDTSSIVQMSIGAEDAPVTIVEYAAFTCPHCAEFNQGSYKKLKSEYIDTGKVRLVYRDFYFNKYGLWAAMVARCGGPEKFFGIADLLYRDQQNWARGESETDIYDKLMKIGRLSGIPEDKLDACMNDGEKAQALVALFQKNAQADDIRGTPTFLINGKKVENQPWPDFKKLIDAELDK